MRSIMLGPRPDDHGVVSMPRQKRDDAARGVYQALNRGNRRQTIFPKHDDYEAFLRVLEEGREKDPVELYASYSTPTC